MQILPRASEVAPCERDLEALRGRDVHPGDIVLPGVLFQPVLASLVSISLEFRRYRLLPCPGTAVFFQILAWVDRRVCVPRVSFVLRCLSKFVARSW